MDKKRGWKGARYQDKAGSQEASKVFNVKVKTEYLNPDYDLEPLQDNRITEQGLLLCAKLKPKIPSLPEFWFRWDEKKDELDVDMYGDTNNRKDWNNERNGYKEHHTVKMKKEARHFKVSIKTPKLNVFNGVISFHLRRDVTISPPTATIEAHAFVPEVSVKTD